MNTQMNDRFFSNEALLPTPVRPGRRGQPDVPATNPGVLSDRTRNPFADQQMRLSWDSHTTVRPNSKTPRMSSLLKFSVITAVPLQSKLQNAWKHSLLMQKHRNWEHIVLEYGGTESRAMWSTGLCSDATTKPTSPLYSRTEALNKGLELANGDVISFLPAHCSFRHNEVLEQVAQVMEDPEVDLVYGNLECFGKSGGLKLVKAGNAASVQPSAAAKLGQMPHEECLFVRRDWWEYLGGLETCYQHSAGTARMLDLLAQPGLQASYIDNAMISCHRTRESNTITLSRWLDEVRAFSKRKLLLQYLTTRCLRHRMICD